MKHKQIYILFFLVIFLKSCSATFPVLAYSQNVINNTYLQPVSYKQLNKGDKIVLSTINEQTYIGKVIIIKSPDVKLQNLLNVDCSNIETIPSDRFEISIKQSKKILTFHSEKIHSIAKINKHKNLWLVFSTGLIIDSLIIYFLLSGAFVPVTVGA